MWSLRSVQNYLFVAFYEGVKKREKVISIITVYEQNSLTEEKLGLQKKCFFHKAV